MRRTPLDQIKLNVTSVSGMLTAAIIGSTRDTLTPEPHEAYGSRNTRRIWDSLKADGSYKMAGMELHLDDDLPDGVLVLQSVNHYHHERYPELDETNFAVIQGFDTNFTHYCKWV